MAWYNENGKLLEYVQSTRVRLARNLADVPFPSKMTPEEGQAVIARVEEALQGAGNFKKYVMASLNARQRAQLIEKHLVSSDLPKSGAGCAFITQDETVSIMVNEEDHVRIQAILPGFALSEAQSLANRIDDALSGRLAFAFHEKFGYVTSCPTNFGTGMRASVMLHLPALTMNNNMGPILNTVGKLGMTVRGLYGEGTKAAGDLYQLSNQVTLGSSEEEIIGKLSAVINEIVLAEGQLRQLFMTQKEVFIKNKCMRALGTLLHSYALTTDEMMAAISDVRLGVSLGILENIELKNLNNFMIMSQSATLMGSQDLGAQQRDIKRAALLKGLAQSV